MKARIIKEPYRLANLKIGEVVEIIPGMETDAEGIWNVPAGKLVLCKKEDGTFTYTSLLDMEMVDESPTVDWAEFRREAAKDILCAIVQHDHLGKEADGCKFKEAAVEIAIIFADELVKQLKEDKK